MSIGSFFSGIFGNNAAQNYQAQDPYVLAANTPNSALGQALAQQQQTYLQQQALGSQLAQQANGQGPSPSQTMLAQALSQSGANANGMVAANRGHYSGMALRDALLANNQATQQAAGTGVAARQQEQLNAQGQLQNLYGTQGSQGLQQQQLLSNASLGSQAINANLQTAGASANGQSAGSALGALGQLGSAGIKMVGGSSSPTDSSGIGNTAAGGAGQADINANPGSTGVGPMPDTGTTYAARGGFIPRRPQMMAAGGVASNPYDLLVSSYPGLAPGIASAGLPPIAAASGGGGGLLGGLPGLGGVGGIPGMGGGGSNPLSSVASGANNALWDGLGRLNHGENGGDQANQFQPFGISGDKFRDLGNAGTNAMARGGSIQTGSRLKAGGNVPGKASVAGDSYANDTVDAKLSPGEIVIDREHSKNAKLAKQFIDELMSQKKKKAAGSGGFGRVLEAHRKLGAALAAAGVK